MKPNADPMKNKKEFIPKVTTRSEDEPTRLKDLLKFARNTAEIHGVGNWNNIISSINKHLKENSAITGDDAISVLTTYLAHYICGFFCEIYEIAKKDSDAGRTKDELFGYLFYGCKKMLDIN